MDSENQLLIDINLADEEALTQLRGVGSRLAKRIIAARPFESIEDLKRVRGISDKDVDRLRPFLSISQEVSEQAADHQSDELEGFSEEIEAAFVEEREAEAITTSSEEIFPGEEPRETGLVALPEIEGEDESAADTSEEEETDGEETVTEEGDLEPISESEFQEIAEIPADEPVSEELEPVSEETGQPLGAAPGYITRGRAIALVFFSCFLTVILAVAITLGIISSLNRGQLTFASPSQIATLQTQVNGLAIQAETVASDLEGLRTRLDNLEALSGRVSDLESEITDISTEMDALQTDINATKAQYDELESQLESVNAQIESLQTQTSRFEAFLEGLRDLLTGLSPDTQE